MLEDQLRIGIGRLAIRPDGARGMVHVQVRDDDGFNPLRVQPRRHQRLACLAQRIAARRARPGIDEGEAARFFHGEGIDRNGNGAALGRARRLHQRLASRGLGIGHDGQREWKQAIQQRCHLETAHGDGTRPRAVALQGARDLQQGGQRQAGEPGQHLPAAEGNGGCRDRFTHDLSPSVPCLSAAQPCTISVTGSRPIRRPSWRSRPLMRSLTRSEKRSGTVRTSEPPRTSRLVEGRMPAMAADRA